MAETIRKLLVICGPTATGKTELALQLSKLFDGELISADSRQVYKYMDIGTGKDLPSDGTKIWGYDLVDPQEKFSVSHYKEYARNKINEIWEKRKLPILVGGSGFYIKSVIDGVSTIDIDVNLHLRENLSGKSAFELFNILAQLNSQRAKKMNISDRNNPRRLIRAIEIYSQVNEDGLVGDQGLEADCLFIGLTAEAEELKKRIVKRVEKRIKQGMEQEVEGLLRKGVDWTDQSMATPGYREWKGYMSHEYDLEKLKAEWASKEIQYARRQMTWFKKDEKIMWFDCRDENLSLNVAKLVKIWYS